MKKLLLAVCVLVMSLGLNVSAAEDTILSGVMVDQLDISGMTKEEALKALEAYEEQLCEQSVYLGIGDNTVEAKLSDFGMSFSNDEIVEEALGIGRTGNIVKRYKDQKDLQHSGKTYSLVWDFDESAI